MHQNSWCRQVYSYGYQPLDKFAFQWDAQRSGTFNPIIVDFESEKLVAIFLCEMKITRWDYSHCIEFTWPESKSMHRVSFARDYFFLSCTKQKIGKCKFFEFKQIIASSVYENDHQEKSAAAATDFLRL